MSRPLDLFLAALVNRETLLNLNSPELRATYMALPEYSLTSPTGVEDGKLWRASSGQRSAPWGGWLWLRGYVPHEPGFSRAADVPVFWLPDHAEVVWEKAARPTEFGHVVLRHRGRELFYGHKWRSTLITWDAWGIEAGTL